MVEKHCGGIPVFVVDWPTSSKPFYAAVEAGRAKAFDLLLPGVGEVCGGTIREHREEEEEHESLH